MMNYIFLSLIIIVFFLLSGIFVKTDNTDPSIPQQQGILVNHSAITSQKGIQLNQVTIITPTPNE